MRVDGNGGVMTFDNMQNRPIMGTVDWTLVSVVLDVPVDADGIALGLLLASGGEAWIDDASFEIVNADVPDTNRMAASPNAANVERIRGAYARAPLVPINLGFEP